MEKSFIKNDNYILFIHSFIHSLINYQLKTTNMVRWIITFLVIALIAGLLGFGGIAGAATGIAQILFWVFLVLLAISVIRHLTVRI